MPGPDAQGSYVFSQNPAAVPNSRKKYRETPVDLSKHNLMWDKRVVRGNTYAAQIPTPNQILAAQLDAQNGAIGRKTMGKTAGDGLTVIDSALPVAGRHHMEVQTEEYLENLDETVMEQEVGSQTDFVIDLPDPVIKYRRPYGEDKYTFIEGGELFDYDEAVDPILKTLMGKTLDVGRQEVLQEEELRWWEEYRAQFEKERQAVIAANQEMEKQALAVHEEKENILSQKRTRYENEKQVARKVACNSYANSFLANFQNHILEALEDHGVFYDPARKAVEDDFLPWIREQVYWQLNERGDAEKELDSIFQKTIQNIKQQADQVKYEKDMRRNVIQAAADAKRQDEERAQAEAEAAAKEEEQTLEGEEVEEEED